MKKIILLGASGGCVDILDAIFDINGASRNDKYDVVGFLDDRKDLLGKTILGAEVLGPFSSISNYPDCHFVTGIGSPENYWRREKIIQSLNVEMERFVTLIHPTASISSSATIGRGSVIFQNVTITTNVKIGTQVLILPNSVVSHDAVVGDYSILNAGVCLASSVRVARSSYIGSNSSVRQGIGIGARSLVGMGSVVVKDIKKNEVVVGNPGRFLKFTK